MKKDVKKQLAETTFTSKSDVKFSKPNPPSNSGPKRLTTVNTPPPSKTNDVSTVKTD